MAKIQKPEAYKMKARSRVDIVAAIMELTQQHDGQTLCFNVKLYDVNLDLPTLLKHWRHCEGDNPHTHHPAWLEAVKEKYDEISQDTLWQWGVEDASSSFVGRGGSGQDDDMFNHLYDGTKVDVEYVFVGRQGGWLAIQEFNGTTFERRKMDYLLKDQLEEMDFDDLKKLYQLILMVKDGTKEESRNREVEYQAAFQFFANVCNDIPEPEDRQQVLFPEAERTEEMILAGE